MYYNLIIGWGSSLQELLATMEKFSQIYFSFIRNDLNMLEFADHFVNAHDDIIAQMKRIKVLVESKFDQPLRTLTLETGNNIKEAYFNLLDKLKTVQMFMGSVVNFLHVIQPMQIWRKPVSCIHMTGVIT